MGVVNAPVVGRLCITVLLLLMTTAVAAAVAADSRCLRLYDFLDCFIVYILSSRESIVFGCDE